MTLQDLKGRKLKRAYWVGTFFSPYRLLRVVDMGPVCNIVTGGGGIEPMEWAADWTDLVFDNEQAATADAYTNGWDGKYRNSGSTIGAGRIPTQSQPDLFQHAA